MGIGWDPRGARNVIFLGHLVVGGSALVVAGVMIVAGRAPNAALDGVLVGWGLLLALAALGFTCFAIALQHRPGDGRGRLVPLALSLIEVVVGTAMAVGLVVAIQGYGAFEPWRSPLLAPAVLLVALGFAGLGVEVVAHRRGTA